MRSTGHTPAYGEAVLRGRDHERSRTVAGASVGPSLAVAMSAGSVVGTRQSVDPNEDVAAVVRGPRAELLVVADGHFGHEASELVVDHLLETLGDDPPPADLSDDELVALFYDAGLAVQHETGRPGFPHPDSRTTLAFALASDDAVQWAALGDSCVVLASTGSAVRVDAPRSAYLGSRFGLADVAAALTRGCEPRSDALVLATDGLVDALGADDEELTAAVRRELRRGARGERLAQRLVDLALERGAADAVTVAVATSSP